MIASGEVAEPPRRGRPRTAKRHFPNGGPLKRHVASAGRKGSIMLAPDHRAIVNAEALFRNRVVEPDDAPRALVSGHNSRKIGARVTKGRWAGLPIYTLTLEERATCPTSCGEWHSCYGNAMNWARRLRHGDALMAKLKRELAAKAREHAQGFVVRLHVLGDFFSPAYVRFWTQALLAFPQLRVFGFTAWPPSSPIGAAVARMSRLAGDRCWLRFSGTEGPRGAVVVGRDADTPHVVCPMQRDRTDCCGTCGLCWTMPRTIAFRRH